MATSEKAAVPSIAEGDNLCVVCFKPMKICSIGQCEHVVCYECSTRMRVLCKQKECPICRTYMPQVVFSRRIRPFGEFAHRLGDYPEDLEFGLVFTETAVQCAYEHLLEFRCQKCIRNVKRFQQFHQLREHMRRDHNLHYCELCLEHVRIFPFERRCYTREELGEHRRKGDTDNTSHRGHPLCEFCNTRFLDGDELFRHLRRDHYFCHLCDADGRKHHFYHRLEDLIKHFAQDHYFCQEGLCRGEPLTSVFPTDIDYKAHVATTHLREANRQMAKHIRTLDLQFPSLAEQRHLNVTNAINSSVPVTCSSSSGGFSSSDFPALRGNLPSTSATTNFYQPSSSSLRNPARLMSAFSGADFPALEPPVVTVAPSPPANVTAVKKTAAQQHSNGLAIQSTSKKNNAAPREAFPALKASKGSSTSSSATMWGKKHQMATTTKPKPPPAPPPSTATTTTITLPQPSDFPSLVLPSKAKNNKKKVNRNAVNDDSQPLTNGLEQMGLTEGGDQTPPSMIVTASTHTNYHQSVDFKQRNQNLMKSFAHLMSTDDIRMLKNYSDLYRTGGLMPRLYFEYVRSALRGDAFDRYFPELLVLLPDIKKQGDLFKLYTGRGKGKLTACPQCKQIVFIRNCSDHYSLHHELSTDAQ